MAISKRQR